MTNPNNERSSCRCTQADLVFVSKRSLSNIGAGIIVLIAIFCLVAYSMGKRSQLLDVDAFIDQAYINERITTQLYVRPAITLEQSDVPPSASQETAMPFPEVAEPISEIKAEPTEIVVVPEHDNLNKENNVDSKTNTNEKFYAQIVSFHNKDRAQKFCARLRSIGIDLIIKTRKNRTSKGSWYQVVTPLYDTHEEVIRLVDAVKLHERIHDVRIVRQA